MNNHNGQPNSRNRSHIFHGCLRDIRDKKYEHNAGLKTFSFS